MKEKVKVVHFLKADGNKACSVKAADPKTTTVESEVTCKLCLKKLAKQAKLVNSLANRGAE